MILHKLCKFCPECQSVFIRRVHRGFIQKYIFRQKPKYKCGNCQAVFFTPLLEKDFKIQVKKSREKAEAEKEMLEIGVDKIIEIEYEEDFVKKA